MLSVKLIFFFSLINRENSMPRPLANNYGSMLILLGNFGKIQRFKIILIKDVHFHMRAVIVHNRGSIS